MPLDADSRRLRAKQVGMLMQAYRHAYLKSTGRKGRLSQEGLLHLMGQVDPQYLERYNHSTVARWESGATRPTRDRLNVFGRALDLSPSEIQGLMRLADLREDQEVPQNVGRFSQIESKGESAFGITQRNDHEIDNPRVGGTYAGFVIRYALTKFALPGLAVGALGYVLARMGWNAGWIMALFVILAVLLVLVQSFLKLRRSHELRELYFITVFFLISGNLLQAPAIRMDPFGFYTIADFANTPMPYLLSTIVNLLLALAAGLMFDFLWRWQYQSSNGFDNVYQRAAWTAFPPLIVVYIFTLLFSCLGTWIYLLLVFSIMGGTITAILAMQDKEMKFNIWEKRLLLQGAVGTILVLTAIGGAVTLILYLQPSPLAIPDHTLLRSWEIDFTALGYSADELLERYRFGAVWSSLATIVYMVIVLGGCTLSTIYRLDAEDPNEPVRTRGSSQARMTARSVPSKGNPARVRFSGKLLAWLNLLRPTVALSKLHLRKP